MLTITEIFIHFNKKYERITIRCPFCNCKYSFRSIKHCQNAFENMSNSANLCEHTEYATDDGINFAACVVGEK